MDARARRMQSERRSLDTLIELPICLLVIGFLAVVALDSFAGLRLHLRGMSPITLSKAPTIAATEYRASTGRWPSSNEEAGFPPPSFELASRLQTVSIRGDGAVDYVFSDAVPALANRTLSFRAWQSSDPSAPIVWRCGRSRAPAPMLAGQDLTTVADRNLLLACRSP